MQIEIERKFLVKDLSIIHQSNDVIEVTQGYLIQAPDRTLRIRKHVPIKNPKDYLTPWGQICFKANISDKSKYEYEFPCSIEHTQELLSLSENLVYKTRYRIHYWTSNERDPIWDIDIFYGDNEGLAIAEIELLSEDEVIEIPDWVGEEVTKDVRYLNSNLSLHPYNKWKHFK